MEFKSKNPIIQSFYNLNTNILNILTNSNSYNTQFDYESNNPDIIKYIHKIQKYFINTHDTFKLLNDSSYVAYKNIIVRHIKITSNETSFIGLEKFVDDYFELVRVSKPCNKYEHDLDAHDNLNIESKKISKLVLYLRAYQCKKCGYLMGCHNDKQCKKYISSIEEIKCDNTHNNSNHCDICTYKDCGRCGLNYIYHDACDKILKSYNNDSICDRCDHHYNAHIKCTYFVPNIKNYKCLICDKSSLLHDGEINFKKKVICTNFQPRDALDIYSGCKNCCFGMGYHTKSLRYHTLNTKNASLMDQYLFELDIYFAMLDKINKIEFVICDTLYRNIKLLCYVDNLDMS